MNSHVVLLWQRYLRYAVLVVGSAGILVLMLNGWHWIRPYVSPAGAFAPLLGGVILFGTGFLIGLGLHRVLKWDAAVRLRERNDSESRRDTP